MAQLKEDEWPERSEPTLPEQQVQERDADVRGSNADEPAPRPADRSRRRGRGERRGEAQRTSRK